MLAAVAALLAPLTLLLTPQQAPELAALVRSTLELCVADPAKVVRTVEDVADADWAQPFRTDGECGLTAEGWRGDGGALVAAARAAVGAEGPDWTGTVRELRVNESGPALWTRLEQAEGWAPASLLIIEPPPGQRSPVEIHFDPAG